MTAIFPKSKVLLPHALVTLADFGYTVRDSRSNFQPVYRYLVFLWTYTAQEDKQDTTNRNASVLIGNLSTTHQHRGQRMYLKDKVVIVTNFKISPKIRM